MKMSVNLFVLNFISIGLCKNILLHISVDHPSYYTYCRFFPIGLDVARIPQQNLVIGGYQIPAGVSSIVQFNLSLSDLLQITKTSLHDALQC